jgi:hypothetical protein
LPQVSQKNSARGKSGGKEPIPNNMPNATHNMSISQGYISSPTITSIATVVLLPSLHPTMPPPLLPSHCYRHYVVSSSTTLQSPTIPPLAPSLSHATP